MTTRREFLRIGLIGGAGLVALGSLYVLRRQTEQVAHEGLTARERALFAALVPALLAGALPGGGPAREQAIGATVEGVARAIEGLSASAQAELAQLLGLLVFAPTRILAAGVLGGWSGASHAEVESFLESWRFSRFALLRSGYAALHDLVLGAWYARPDAWEAIGYPGPPEVFP
jgi:hypothetical protein